MRKVFTLFMLCVSGFALKAQTDTLSYRILAQNVQQEFAPDARSVYFKARISGDTILLESSSANALKAFSVSAEKLKGLVVKSSYLPDEQLQGKSYGVANLSVTNNRRSPGNAPEMLTQMTLGTPLRILKKERGYYLVRTPDGYLSYTDGSAIAQMDSLTFQQWQNAAKVIFTADYGNAYNSTKKSALRVSDLVAGNILEVLSADKHFYKVRFPDQRIAYVQKSQATPFKQWSSRPDPSADAILASAKTLIGVPYLWGGTSVKGVDCSGFTKTSYFLNGIIIPRDASQQVLAGMKVDIEEGDSISLDKCLKNLKAGDLLFFSAAKLKGNKNGRVTHTAIYMGDGKFIQAAGMVMISSLKSADPDFDSRQWKSLVAARRYLTAIGTPEITRVNQHAWYNTRLANSL